MAQIDEKEKVVLVRVDSEDPDFRKLVELLDEELKLFDGDMHDFYHQYNGVDHLKHIVLVYVDDIIAGCGAFKPFDDMTVEVKRMYVAEAFRRRGLAALIVADLEQWALDLGYSKCILETGLTQVAALKLYKSLGYEQIENFAPYVDVSTSVCYGKRMS